MNVVEDERRRGSARRLRSSGSTRVAAWVVGSPSSAQRRKARRSTSSSGASPPSPSRAVAGSTSRTVTSDYFAGPVAERYDASLGEWGTRRDRRDGRLSGRPRRRRCRTRVGNRNRPDRAAADAARHPRARHRPLDRHGRAAASEARRRGNPGHVWRFRHHAGRGNFALAYLVFNTINNLTTQEAQTACFENAAAHLGRAAPSSSRSACLRPRPADRLRPERHACRHRRVRRRHAAARLASLHAVRRSLGARFRAFPRRLAGRARPDGPARRDDAARALGRLEPRAVHK